MLEGAKIVSVPEHDWSLSFPKYSTIGWYAVDCAWSIPVLYPNNVLSPASEWYAPKTLVVLIASKELPPSLNPTWNWTELVAGWQFINSKRYIG